MTQGMVFDIQHFSVHDGPGIRTLVFLKGCPLSCPWCCNPESKAFHAELRHSSFRCRACGVCAKVCPSEAIHMGTGGPTFDRTPCPACDGWPCVEACPQSALSPVGQAMTVPGNDGADRSRPGLLRKLGRRRYHFGRRTPRPARFPGRS